ncbi:hypothetical protein [Diaphorobacter caeni]|uniref:hypothetical protein n=1 Tax=Diaphorobacter caeni TaxID=2784387 RepID=UPI00188F4685|nr:hypothetical protein [Diaphorobacter caeni]MBF5006845.1 hypothetical protein [Diaphorobacter caeni]
MTVKLSTGLRNAACGTLGIAGALNGGVLEIYSGPQPVSADSAVTGTKLGVATLDAGAWVAGAPANGLEFDAPAGGGVAKPSAAVWKFIGLAVGQAGWVRFIGNAPDDGSASATLPRLDMAAAAGGGDFKMSSIAITVGLPVTIDVFSVALPAQ